MSRSSAIALGVAVLVAATVAAVFLTKRSEPGAPVAVRLRLAVSPADQTGFVVAQANSARFKYEIGKKAGLKPILAQKLTVVPIPNTAAIEVRVNVQTPEEGRSYADSFVELLQAQCGGDLGITLLERSVR